MGRERERKRKGKKRKWREKDVEKGREKEGALDRGMAYFQG